MISNSSVANVIHLTVLVVGCVLLLRKVAEIDGYHGLKVFVLTAIFSSPFIVGFFLWVYFLCNPPSFVCGTWEYTH
jgi:hypothetical protein